MLHLKCKCNTKRARCLVSAASAHSFNPLATALDIARCTFSIAHCPLLDIAHCPLLDIARCPLQCIEPISNCAMHFPNCAMHWTLCSMHCTLCIVRFHWWPFHWPFPPRPPQAVSLTAFPHFFWRLPLKYKKSGCAFFWPNYQRLILLHKSFPCDIICMGF